MLQELTIPALVIRGSESDMFAAETLPKVRTVNPRITAIEISGSHDLANDNPDGLVAAIREFLEHNEGLLKGS
jgi:pimeloyl-ACP methyl ester carboxylesterase